MIRPPEMDDLRRTGLIHSPATLLARLSGQMPLLAGLGGLILLFVALGGLRVDLAILGYLVLVGLVAMLPQPVVTVTHTVQVQAPAPNRHEAEEDMLPAFVEALGDPGLVLDRTGAVLHRNGAAARQYPNLQVGRVMTLVMPFSDL